MKRLMKTKLPSESQLNYDRASGGCRDEFIRILLLLDLFEFPLCTAPSPITIRDQGRRCRRIEDELHGENSFLMPGIENL